MSRSFGQPEGAAFALVPRTPDRSPTKGTYPMTEQVVFTHTGSDKEHPTALIARNDIGYETLFVATLLKDKVVLRVGRQGYRAILKRPDADVWMTPSASGFSTLGLSTAAEVREAVKAAYEYFDAPLSADEVEELAAACASIPRRSQGAANTLRVSVGHTPVEAAWIDPRWTLRARKMITGV